MQIRFEELAQILVSESIQVDGKAVAVDVLNPPNAYTSRYLHRDTMALLVDLDSPDYVPNSEGVWNLPSGYPPTLDHSISTLLWRLGVTNNVNRITVPYCLIPSSQEGHHHLYILSDLTASQSLLVHGCLTYLGIEGWGNLLRSVERGYAMLFWPGEKAKLGKRGESTPTKQKTRWSPSES